VSKTKLTIAQLLARPDTELRIYDAAKVAVQAGLILETQLEKDGAWFRVQDIDHKSGALYVKAGGIWQRNPYRTIFYRTIADYNAAVRERSAHV
jgi:hypothetical protein